MITLISLASLQNPNFEMINDNNISSKPRTQNVRVVHENTKLQRTPFTTFLAYANSLAFKDGYKQEFNLPQNNQTNFKNFDEVVAYYETPMKNVVKDFAQRKDIDGQFLKWVDLPKNQLARNEKGISHVDEIYAQANILKSRKTANGEEKPLVVLGIGGSKHTAEFLLNMNGVGNKGKVYFYSDIDPVSFENFLKEVNKDLRDLNFLVVSKSGTTFETSDAYRRFENKLIEIYKKEGYEENSAKLKAQLQFAVCTDKNPTDKNLRGQIGSRNGVDNNYLKELYIHDDVGGRFSMFDDSGIFALAYSGVDILTTQRILKAAANTSDRMLNAENLKDNPAAKSAIYNEYSRENGFNIIQQQYFGKIFESGGENWAKQLYLESLKDFAFMIGKAPDSMHYATEGHYSSENRSKYATVMTVMTPDISENYKKYISAISQTYNETTPVKMEILSVDSDKLKPEAIGEYIQTKHFETVYSGMLRRSMSGVVQQPEKLPEVFQPSVEVYKNKFKMGEYKLTPGS